MLSYLVDNWQVERQTDICLSWAASTAETSTAKCLGLRKLSLLSCDVDGYGGGGGVAVAMA